MHFFGRSPSDYLGEKSRWRQIVWPIITQSTLTQSCKHFLGRLLWCDGWWWDDHQLVDIPPPQMISFCLDRFFIAICENFSPTQFSASVSKRFHRIPISICWKNLLKNLKSCFFISCESKRNYLRGEWNHEKIITASWYCCLQWNFMYIGNTFLNDPHFWKFNIIGNFNFSIKNMWKDTSKIAFKEIF